MGICDIMKIITWMNWMVYVMPRSTLRLAFYFFIKNRILGYKNMYVKTYIGVEIKELQGYS